MNDVCLAKCFVAEMAVRTSQKRKINRKWETQKIWLLFLVWRLDFKHEIGIYSNH